MTEKQYAPNKTEGSKQVLASSLKKQERKKMTSKVETPKADVKAPVKEDKKIEEKTETKKPEKKVQKKISSEQVRASSSKNRERKRDFAIVNGPSMHISTKYAMAICKFIKRKNIDRAISDVEDVLAMRKSVPMKGEIPHRKGPGKVGSGAGRFPIKAAETFHMLLKSLKSNANANNMDNPVVTEAYANQASRPMGRFGRWQRKRTHVFIKVTEKKSNKQNKGERK